MNARPKLYKDVETCVEETLSKVGRRVALGTPLGLGKANHLVNEFFRRASRDSSIDLHIFTALTLARPHAGLGTAPARGGASGSEDRAPSSGELKSPVHVRGCGGRARLLRFGR